MRTLILSLLFTLGLGAGGHAFAQEKPVEDQPPYSMPTQDLFTDEELKTQFEYRNATPYGDESLAVSLPCRTSWKWAEVKSDAKESYQKLIPLVRAEAPDDPTVAIEMKYILLQHDVRLEDWVAWFLEAQGMFTVGGQVGTYFGRRTADGLAEYKADGGAVHVARIGFFKSGNRIYMTAGSAPKDKYERYAKEFALAVTRATPKQLSTEEFAEPVKEYKFRAPRKLGFIYPASWTLSEVKDTPPGIGAAELFLGDPKKPTGLIKVRVYSREKIQTLTVDKATWTIFEELKAAASDLEMVAKPHELEAATELFPGKGRMAVYEVKLGTTPMEVHELILEREDTIFSVHLVTPPKERLPYPWLINRRAFEIVGMKLRLES